VPEEILKRFGTDPEPAEHLAEQAAAAEAVLGIHGVSVTARPTTAPADTAARGDVESTSAFTTPLRAETRSTVR
jgi:hypothetical protein